MNTRAKRIIDSAPPSRKMIVRPRAPVAIPTFQASNGKSEFIRRKKKALAKSSGICSEPIVTPPLLLEGDRYFISEDGIARTLYRTNCQSLQTPISVEEVFDMKRARKRFVVRSNPTGNNTEVQVNDKIMKGYVSPGHEISSIDLKEVEDGIFGGAGTGSTTWESSIVMSMIFSAHPELLYGDVIELGSGVGLGGVLNALGPYSSFSTEMKSMTLTDCSPQVLQQCASNVTSSTGSSRIPIRVENLDWYDFHRKSTKVSQYCGRYDTIIACDCACMYPDIEALTQTMISLIRRNPRSRIHIFGPHDRGGLHELVRQLRSQDLKLEIHPIDMQRYRLMPTGEREVNETSQVYGSRHGIQYHSFPFATKSYSTFLHVTCMPYQTQSIGPSMFELD
jgi:hypothetical protein